jgi:hypothetical protein
MVEGLLAEGRAEDWPDSVEEGRDMNPPFAWAGNR